MKKSKSIFSVWFILSVIVLLTGLSTAANAIPAFARKSGISCSVCHSAWPALNKVGRDYKENGYRFTPLQVPNIKVTDHLKWDENLPVSVMLVARPYDKKDSGDLKVRALHEAEIMIGGPMGENMSGFFEIEGEDEDVNARGLEVGIPLAQLTFNQSAAVNIQFSYAAVMYFDPYETYTDSRRMTRGHISVVDQRFAGADNNARLRDSRQNIIVFGRPIPNLFYGVGFSGNGGDPEGVAASTVILRVAYEVTPDIMLGLMSVSGTNKDVTNQYDFADADTDPTTFDTTVTDDYGYQRMGLDFQVVVKEHFTISGAYVTAADDVDDVVAVNTVNQIDNKNMVSYVQVMYINHDDARTNWAPLLRYDSYEKNDGANTINEFTLGMNYYFSDNVRGMAEYWDRAGDGSTADDNRLTFQLLAAF